MSQKSPFTGLPTNLVKAYVQNRRQDADGNWLETVYYINAKGECWTSGEVLASNQFNPQGRLWSLWAREGGLPTGQLVCIGNYQDPQPTGF
jgi:hypothetical protein